MAQAFATMMDGTRREVPVEVNGNLFRNLWKSIWMIFAQQPEPTVTFSFRR